MSLVALNLGISKNQYPPHKPCEGELLVVGSGRCVWDDIQKVNRNNFDIMALNDMIPYYPGDLRHAYSNDWKMLPKWVESRRPRYKIDYRMPIQHSCYGNRSWPWPGHGSSGLNACYTGLALGYSRVVLAGVPLDDSGHFFDAPWTKTNFVKEAPDRYWVSARDNVFEGRVLSLSGRSKSILS